MSNFFVGGDLEYKLYLRALETNPELTQCPRCKASTGEPCRMESGKIRHTFHSERWAIMRRNNERRRLEQRWSKKMPAEVGQYKMKTKFSNGLMKLIVSHYHFDPNQPALQVIDAITFEPIMTASVMLEGVSPKEDEIFIKVWSENEGIDSELIRLNLISANHRKIPTGYVEAHGHKMEGDLLGAWNAHKAAVQEDSETEADTDGEL